MTRSSDRRLSLGLSCALALFFTWLSSEVTARAAGGVCPTPPVLLTSDSGSTAAATNHVPLVPLACDGVFTQVAGPDVFYEIPVGAGNDFTVTVAPGPTYDTSIYLLSTCGDGTTCAANHGADDHPEGVAESLALKNLAPGTYFLAIDSFYPAADSRSSGSYTVSIGGALGAQLSSVVVTPSAPTSAFGQPVTFTAVVTAPIGTPSGSITFAVDGASQPAVALDASGQAVFATSTLSVGLHTIVASYAGTPSFLPATGSTSQTVTADDAGSDGGGSGASSDGGDGGGSTDGGDGGGSTDGGDGGASSGGGDGGASSGGGDGGASADAQSVDAEGGAEAETSDAQNSDAISASDARSDAIAEGGNDATARSDAGAGGGPSDDGGLLSPDGGESPGENQQPGGCSCDVVGSRGADGGLMSLIVGACLVAARERRRRRLQART